MITNIKKHGVLAVLITFCGSNPIIAAHHENNKEYNQAANKKLHHLIYHDSGFHWKAWVTPKVLSLVRNNADPNFLYAGAVLLREYSTTGDIEAVQTLLQHKADPNIGSDQQREDVPLFHAASYDMVQLLCSAKADVHYRSVNGYCQYSHNNSALHNAAYRKKRPCVIAALCQAGLDPNMPNRPDSVYGESAADLVKHSCQAVWNTHREETNEQIKRIGVLFWYGADREKLERQPDYLSQKFRTRITNFLGKLSDKKQQVRDILIAPRVNEVMALADLITDYAGAPLLTPHDINAWDALIEN